MKCLLDTCTFLWLAQQPSRISQAAAALINDEENSLHVADAAIWEIVMKHSTGRLPLPSEPRAWITRKLRFHHIARVELDLESILLSGELPKTHQDPFDRLIAAQALTHGMCVLSPDAGISKLGAARIW